MVLFLIGMIVYVLIGIGVFTYLVATWGSPPINDPLDLGLMLIAIVLGWLPMGIILGLAIVLGWGLSKIPGVIK